jgi:hypothetical protein
MPKYLVKIRETTTRDVEEEIEAATEEEAWQLAEEEFGFSEGGRSDTASDDGVLEVEITDIEEID